MTEHRRLITDRVVPAHIMRARAEYIAQLAGTDADQTEAVLRALDSQPSAMWIIRRDDGEPMGDYEWFSVDSSSDWQVAEVDSDGSDEPIPYSVIRLVAVAELQREYLDGRQVVDDA